MKLLDFVFKRLIKPEEKQIARASLVILLLAINLFLLLFPKYFGAYISSTAIIIIVCFSYVASIILLRQNLNEQGRRILDKIALALQLATFGIILALIRNWTYLRIIAFLFISIGFFNFIYGVQLIFKYLRTKSDNNASKPTQVLGIITSVFNIILLCANIIKLFR